MNTSNDQTRPPRNAGTSSGSGYRPRLQKVLAVSGLGSRRQCEELILSGRVTINGELADQLGSRVDPRTQQVEVDGLPIEAERLVYWWVNKPKGVVSTNAERERRRRVIDLLPAEVRQRVFPVGRLDEESTGLILVTNDGELANRLAHPRFGVTKTYKVLVSGSLPKSSMDKLLRGVWLADGKVRPKSIKRLAKKGEAQWLEVVLAEGHNREIRRMFSKLGHRVLSLQRVAVGPVKIRKLPLGSSRPLTADELGMLKRQAYPKLATEGESEDESQASKAGPKARRPMKGPRGPKRPSARRDAKPIDRRVPGQDSAEAKGEGMTPAENASQPRRPAGKRKLGKKGSPSSLGGKKPRGKGAASKGSSVSARAKRKSPKSPTSRTRTRKKR